MKGKEPKVAKVHFSIVMYEILGWQSVQVVDCLPRKCEALNSDPSTIEKNNTLQQCDFKKIINFYLKFKCRKLCI
jgi:hypothetical protein